jgi:hypothetical protein
MMTCTGSNKSTIQWCHEWGKTRSIAVIDTLQNGSSSEILEKTDKMPMGGGGRFGTSRDNRLNSAYNGHNRDNSEK